MSVTLFSEIGFYVGDPSYVLTNQELSSISNLEGKGSLTNPKTGEQFNVFLHQIGISDAVLGGYKQNITVCSGLIGVVPMELIHENNWGQQSGELFNLKSIEVEVEKQGDNSVLTIKMGGEEYQINPMQYIIDEFNNYSSKCKTLMAYKEDLVSKANEIIKNKGNSAKDALRQAMIDIIGWDDLYDEYTEVFFGIVEDTPYEEVPLYVAWLCQNGDYRHRWFQANKSSLTGGGVEPLNEKIDLKLRVINEEINDKGEKVSSVCEMEKGHEIELLGLFVNTKYGALLFSIDTSYIISHDTTLEDLSEAFEVFKYDEIKVNHATNRLTTKIYLQNKKTRQMDITFDIDVELD